MGIFCFCLDSYFKYKMSYMHIVKHAVVVKVQGHHTHIENGSVPLHDLSN